MEYQMGTLQSTLFGLQLSNLPFINIRLDFNTLLALFRSEHFRKQFADGSPGRVAIKTHDFSWHGRPPVLLTHLLRHAIVSIECAVSGAVFVEALDRGTMTPKVLAATKNPFDLRLPGKVGTAARVYNHLPSLIDTCFELQEMNPDLWDKTKLFYKEVRNPLFHAYEIADHNPDPVWHALEYIWELFQWLNGWHSIQTLATGPLQFHDGGAALTSIPNVPDLRLRQVIPPRTIPEPRPEGPIREDLRQAPGVEDILGMSLPSEDKVCLTMRGTDGKYVNIELSAHAAMKMLGFLAIAHEQRGWEIPERLW